ncbi:hypothetical protein OO013_11280 [Mangrovivirga sp. M17]|uniref:Deoxyribose-phosphate aldolase n=1 Tax=Mangrovivirga halotolerans TaxID=2993936 RepID=A0ABT3RSA8_9BACT|nr:DUF6503 family protein [Mangrovivirga halotolerans]MCX2744453.1 hypothetical protein [Mangrovivirga halotolerans]
MRRIFTAFLLAGFFISCTGHKNQTEEANRVTNIINNTIEAHGANALENGKLNFIFRNGHYTVEEQNGQFKYERLISKGDSVYRDILTNEKFVRLYQGDTLELTPSEVVKYRNGLNAVVYFATLPQSLSDDAVVPEYLGDMTIKGNEYYKIKISFEENGGGQDHEDVFVYWINKDTDLIDYLAYDYKTNGGGMRFREAFNKRNVNGVVIQDYNNYKPTVSGLKVQDIDELFVNGDLELVSVIKTEEPEVEVY